VASLVLGILAIPTGCLGIGILFGLIGLVLGIIALTQIGKPGKASRGTGMAIAGVVLGGVCFVLVPLYIGMMLPALGAARRSARQMQTMTQARGLQAAMSLHAQASGAGMPADIAVLLEGNYTTVDYLLSPMANQSVPSGFATWPQNQKNDWVRQNASYVLVPALADTNGPVRIAVFGRPEHHGGAGIPVAYNDGHAVWEKNIAAVDQALKAQTGLTMQQLIDRQTGSANVSPSGLIRPATPRQPRILPRGSPNPASR
jgi:hypothetical protein